VDNTISMYLEAAKRAYPQKQWEVKYSHKRMGEPHYHVLINHEQGPETLTLNDLREATRQFNKGR